MERSVMYRWLLAIVIHCVALHAGFYLRPGPLPLDRLTGTSSEPWQGPASRLVLVIVRGLRAEALFARVSYNNFLAEKVKIKGSWGVSFGAPLEPGEGMVVMGTGLPGGGHPKDVDNLFKHCKSVYVGPPSPVAFFKEDFINTSTYSSEWEDPALSPNQTQADEWVFKKWHDLWISPSLEKLLRAEKVLIVIYLNGLDIACHLEGINSYRADKETLYILRELENAYKSTQRFYKDDKTAYILTSDHGFGEDKNHDRSSDNETMMPLISWGAGISGPTEGRSGTPSSWGLDGIKRRDVLQKDIPALIASLLGITFPSTSFGNVPILYIRDIEVRAKAIYSNAIQLTLLYSRVMKNHGTKISSFLAPLDTETAKSSIRAAAEAYQIGDYATVISLCQSLSESALSGIEYYQWYETRIITLCIGLSFIGWSCICFGWILLKLKVTPVLQRELPPRNEEESKAGEGGFFRRHITLPVMIDLLAVFVFGLSILFLFLDNAPFIIFPSVLLFVTISWLVIRNAFQWIKLYKSFLSFEVHTPISKPLMHGVFFLTFSYFLDNNLVLHVLFAFALIFSALSDLRHSSGLQLASWLLTSIAYLLLFHHDPLPPRPHLLINSALIWITLSVLIMRFLKVNYVDWPIFIAYFLSVCLIVGYAQFGPPTSSSHFPFVWCPVSLLCFIPLIGSAFFHIRLGQIFVCLSIPIFILSVSNEPFSLIFCIYHFFAWYRLEHSESLEDFRKRKVTVGFRNVPIDWNHIRRSLYFIAYLLTSFKALGNPVDPEMWNKAWPDYFSPSSTVELYLLMICKHVSTAGVLTVLMTDLGRSSPSGVQASILFLFSLLTFLHLIFEVISVTSHYKFIQICILIHLLLQPFSYLLLAPSLYFTITKPKTPQPVGIPLQPIVKPADET